MKTAALTGAGTCETVPAEPYSAEDLNYSDNESRAALEINDLDVRPENDGADAFGVDVWIKKSCAARQ